MYSNTLLHWDYHNTGIVKDLDVQQHTVLHNNGWDYHNTEIVKDLDVQQHTVTVGLS